MIRSLLELALLDKISHFCVRFLQNFESMWVHMVEKFCSKVTKKGSFSKQMGFRKGSINGLGTDIIEIERIREALERHGERFIDRLFTEKEKAYCLRYKDSTARFAGRFAAKEAILKAFGTGLSPEATWQEIEILNNEQGKPEVHLSPRLQETFFVANMLLSISHCDAYATATAIFLGKLR